jgi:hypothetical protein
MGAIMSAYRQKTDATGTRADAAVSAWIVGRVVLIGLVVLALAAAGELVRAVLP